MSTPHDPDHQFHENLQAMGRHIGLPESPSDEVRSRCLAQFRGAPPARGAFLRRPAVLSTVSLAACLTVAVGLLFPTHGGPTVQAATILKKLHEQIEQPELIEITMDSIAVDELRILNGHLQVTPSGVAGDIHVIVEEGNEGPLEVDLSLALSPERSWILIRKLQIPDADAQPFVSLFFPPGTETLLILPEDVNVGDIDLDLDDLPSFSSAELSEAFQQLLAKQPDTGATMVEQRDGTILMTLPIENAEALKGLILLGAAAGGDEADLDEVKKELEGEISIDDDLELISGSTLEIVYDPKTEQVRSFAIRDFGEQKGTISIAVRDGEPDASLFDSRRVTTPNTRTFDLTALESLLGQLQTKTHK